MDQKQDIVVIGAGVAGLAAAYYLQKSGRQVTVVEKGQGRDNCSYGNAGMIVPSHIVPLSSPGVISQGLRWMFKAESPFYIKPRMSLDLLSWGWKFYQASSDEHVKKAGPVLKKLLLKTRSLLTEIEQTESLDFSYHQNGLFMLCKTQEGLDEEIELAKKARNLGLPVEILSAGETREKEPAIDMDIIGATYFPKDSHLHPGLLMDQLKKILVDQGVQIHYETEVTAFKTNKDRVQEIQLKHKAPLEPRQVVICAGAYSSGLAEKLNRSLPMQAGKGYSITLDNQQNVPGICALLAEAKVSMTPMDDSIRFGGTMEIAGNDTSVTPSKIKALKKSVTRYFPEFSSEELDQPEIWSGLRPCSPDGLPYVGKLKDIENCFTSTGHAMMGMSLSFSTAQLLTELMNGKDALLYDPMISPNRYL